VATGLSRTGDAAGLGLRASNGTMAGIREFLHAFQGIAETLPSTDGRIRLETPLLDLSYGQAILLAQRFGVPLERTWSCEAPANAPCRACEGCKARARAFAEALQPDPLLVPASAPVGPLRTITR
jgi:7-cyano-7-deazaguanine synthase in queuosine biosynthesis